MLYWNIKKYDVKNPACLFVHKNHWRSEYNALNKELRTPGSTPLFAISSLCDFAYSLNLSDPQFIC